MFMIKIIKNSSHFLLREQRQQQQQFWKCRNKHQRQMTETVIEIKGAAKNMRENPAFKIINTPEFRKIFTNELKTLIDIFKRYNYELRIAGGAVRDILMAIDPKDIDLATTATPEQMKAMFEKENVRMINAKGEKHGTITPRILDKMNFEVTTLRIDVCTDGRHAEVQFTTSWQLDANRRDLTINSMFLGFDGTVYDYFYGYDDLQKRRIVFVGDAAVRIQEDYLRILRYFRFYGRIAENPNKHDADTIKAIREHGGGLARISGERIWTELQKIIVGNFNCDLMLEILSCNLGIHCGLPEKPNLEEFKRVCKVLENVQPPHNAILYMTALLNTPEDAINLHARLKLSAFERDLSFFIVQQRNNVDIDYADLRSCQKMCLQQNANRAFVEQLLKYSNKLSLYENLTAWQMPRFPLSGNMLTKHGCKADKKLGIIMNQLRGIWIDNNFQLTADDLIAHLPEVIEKVKNTTKSNDSPSSPKRKC